MKAPAPLADTLGWGDLDAQAVATAKALAADAVEKVGNGHPGTPISLASAAYYLYQNAMRHDPNDPTWLGRDRFVLSAGHASLLQYVQLFLGGWGLELPDLESLRTWGSQTPGHPEYHETAGVEITTGPLGTGIASAVGMAMAARRERGLLDPDAPAGASPFDHHVFVVAGDGCLQEGVASEASSLAGTQKLGNLILLWDDNHITIEGHTNIAFTEDVMARYAAYGWHTESVDWTNGGTEYRENIDALAAAVEAAKAETERPTIIRLRTIMAWPSPTKQDSHDAHGSKLGAEEIAGLKEVLGLDPAKNFQVDADVLAHTRQLQARGAAAHSAWDEAYNAWRAANPDRAALLDRLRERALPADLDQALPVFEAGTSLATRAASGKVLGALAGPLPELWGGSADLAGSNNTTMAGQPSFLPADRSTEEFSGDVYGRTLHFGIREFGMGAILNGIGLHGLTRPYGGTFFTFSDFMRGAVRLGAIMQIGATYVWTHDSIGVGEDGPTHQPVEHLAALRAMPGLAIVRPADANETAAAWLAILGRDAPAGLVLSRQNLPVFPRGQEGFATTDGVARGAYVLLEAGNGQPEVILVATGSEVALAVTAREQLEADGIATRVVSAPCLEWFAEQDAEYRASVLPASVRARVSVEAGVAQGWHAIVGDAGRTVSLEHFGASADAATLFREFGFTPQAVVAAAKDSLAAARG